MSLRSLQLLPLFLLPAASAEHLAWKGPLHYPQVRHELTNAEKNAFAHLTEPVSTTAGSAVVEWDVSTRTLTTRSWTRGQKDGTARYTEKIQRINSEGTRLTTLTRSRLHNSGNRCYTATDHTAAKPYLFVHPPTDIVEGQGISLEQWDICPDGQFRGTTTRTYAPGSMTRSLHISHVRLSPALKEPDIRLMDGVQPFPAPADEPILTGGNSYHRRPKAAVYDPSTRILTWECRRHPGKKQNYKALGPFNIYQFRVAPDNKSVEITRRIYCSGYTAPLLRTCRLTTDTPGRFTDSYGYLYYFTLTPDGHIATYSRSPGTNVRRDNGSRGPVFIYPPKQKQVSAANFLTCLQGLARLAE